MYKINRKKEYEIYWVDSGLTEYMTGAKVIREFGKNEANEALNGHDPRVCVIEL